MPKLIDRPSPVANAGVGGENGSNSRLLHLWRQARPIIRHGDGGPAIGLSAAH